MDKKEFKKAERFFDKLDAYEKEKSEEIMQRVKNNPLYFYSHFLMGKPIFKPIVLNNMTT